MRSTSIATLVAISASVALSASTPAQELDSVDEAFVSAIMNEPGKAQAEFDVYAEKNPLLTSYYVGLAVSDRCRLPKPSDVLYKAAGGDGALKTRDGRWTFIVSVAFGSMSFPTKEQEASFCRTAGDLLVKSEAEAAKAQ